VSAGKGALSIATVDLVLVQVVDPVTAEIIVGMLAGIIA
jgi:hypothetical protein